MNHLRLAARRLSRAPAFTLSAILTLALGIGGTTAVFTVVNGVLLEPLPFPHPDRLVDLSHTLQVSGALHVDQSDATFMLYRQESHAFSDIGVYRAAAVNVGGVANANGGTQQVGEPERVPAAWTSASMFGVLQASSMMGRRLRDADDDPGAVPVVVLGQRFWERKFGGNPAIVGRHVMIDGAEREVVGIMPSSFRFPERGTALWLPLTLDPAHTKSAAFDFRGVGRLRDGVSIAAATADLQRLLPHVPDVFPGRLTAPAIAATHMRAEVHPLRDVIVGDVGRVLWIVLGASGVLLLIACANVASLFLARAEGRQRDLAVRRALGAGRSVLLEEFLSEAVLLAAAGAVIGVVLAALGVRLLQAADTGAGVPRLAEVHVNGVVLAATACIAALAAIIVSAVTVLRSGGASLSAVLMASGTGASGGRTRSLARRFLVAAQVALALILLSGAGLLARSFASLLAVNPGFDASNALTFRMALPTAAYPGTESAARVMVETLDALREAPGVGFAGIATKLPLDETGRQDSAVFLEDHPLQPGQIPDVHEIVFVSPDYFRAMGISLIAGRTFAAPDPAADTAHLPREVIVSTAFARRYWHGQSALGRRVRMNANDPWSTVVGVAASTHDAGLDQPPTDVVYSPLISVSAAGTPWTPRDVAFVVRGTGAGHEAAFAAIARRAVDRVAPALPIYHVRPVSDLIADGVSRTNFTLLVLGIAAVVAMVIGAMGIYGVIAYLVSLRTRELGVRLALGARPQDVRRLVVRHGVTDAALGVVAGLIVAAGLTRVLTSVLYGVSPTDPVTLIGAALALLITAVAASWIPARRAASLDPAGALRE